MLYDPKWEKNSETKPHPSLEGLIAWLETKNPSERYDWSNCEGRCLIGQYGASLGLSWREINRAENGDPHTSLYYQLSTSNHQLALRGEHTFGGALERARAALADRT